MAIGPSMKGAYASYLLSKLPIVTAIGFALAIPVASNAASSGRQLEEIVVTAERQEASVQDTSISITAFTAEMLEDFGIRDQTDLQNFIPATVILPYDAVVRGVGRNFRNLGGDPGISTYMNGVYSEDLYTATIGSFWDMERIEVLRGPQGTLYGRNAVGGAMNFIYNKANQDFYYKFKGMAGNLNAREFYGTINGALIEDQLSARFAFSNRNRDGYVKDLGGGPDLDSRGEENYALSLTWTPRDDLTVHVRSNIARVYRVMGGGDGGGLVVFRGESVDGLSRDFSQTHFGFRSVDPAQTNPLASDYIDPNMAVTSFTNPTTGEVIRAQRNRSGIDESEIILFNQGFGSGNSTTRCVFHDKENIKGKDLCAYTNGGNFERFDQHGIQFEANWDVNDNLSLKYIYGFNDLSYQRITEDDSTFNTTSDRQFYVNHEAQYESHELQAFFDVTEDLSFTTGIFFYSSVIDQRGDFFNANATGLYVTGATDPLGANLNLILGPALGLGTAPIDLFTAKNNWIAANGLANTDTCLIQAGCPAVGTAFPTDFGDPILAIAIGLLHGDTGDSGAAPLRVKHGPDTQGTDLLYTTRSRRDATAAYAQGVWNMSDVLTLTFGLRWAEDKLAGEENVYRSTTMCALTNTLCGLVPFFSSLFGLPNLIDPTSVYYTGAAGVDSLGSYNVLIGALDPITLQPTGAVPVLQSIPISLSVYRAFKRTDDEITYRLNLDWDIDDNSMMYFSVTTGYRGGGFNLVFFSETHQFDPEKLISYEIGYKAQLLNNTLQLNSAIYLYDYETIHTFGSEVTAIGGTTASVLEAPGAEILGFEIEGMWLATDRITIGGNLSFTPSEYTKTLLIRDADDVRFPCGIRCDLPTGRIISADDSNLDIKGKRVLQVPDSKGSLWASYALPLANNGSVDFMLSYSYISDVYYKQFETEADKAPAYDRWDFRASWKSPSEDWRVTGFVSNILDDIGIRQIETHGATEGYRRTGQVTEPRMYGLEVTYSLGN